MTSDDYELRLKTGRNDPCPCGSGKKYKKCHAAEDQAQRSAAFKAAEEEAKAKAAAKEEEEEEDAAGNKPRDRNKRVAGKSKGGAANKAPTTGGKPNNMPRRSSV
jgi:SEC-C motif